MSKVVITGAGVVSPLGSSFREFMRGLQKKYYGLDHIQNFDTNYFPVKCGGEVREKGKVINTPLKTDRKSHFIIKAVGELMENCPDFNSYHPENRMIHLGTGIDHFNIVDYINSGDFKKNQWQNHCIHSDVVLKELANKYQIKGGISTNVAACVASTQAIGLSFRILKESSQIAIITGGYDSMLCHLHYMGFYKLGALSQGKGDPRHSCKPFDKNRDGLVLGEGGVAFLMQREEEVKKGIILAEVCGYSSTMDAYKVTDPLPGGESLARAASQAIREAGIPPLKIDCVHLHGTGTFKNAIAEANALKRVFPQTYKKIPVFSMKGQIGHLIGACGAMEILGVIYSLQNQVVPPTLNFNEPDPEVPLNVIRGEPLEKNIDYVLKLNSGFGGQNTALVLKKYGT
jgi:3-oxoacyl-[acyl-carrier-protein] synthase II